jgi:hypothetical protein
MLSDQAILRDYMIIASMTDQQILVTQGQAQHLI